MIRPLDTTYFFPKPLVSSELSAYSSRVAQAVSLPVEHRKPIEDRKLGSLQHWGPDSRCLAGTLPIKFAEC